MAFPAARITLKSMFGGPIVKIQEASDVPGEP